MWEADKDHTDPSKSYEELLSKVKDCSRRRKLDSSVNEKMSWNDDTGGGYDQGDGVYALVTI